MAKRKSSKIKVFPIILILLLLLGAIAGFAVLIKNVDIDEDNKPDSELYVEINNKTILASAMGYVVFPGNSLNVAVKSSLNEDARPEYTTKIEVDPSVKFTFVKDGKLCLFLSSEDVSGFFEFEDTDSGFVLSCDGKTVTDMLECLYASNSITVDERPEYYDKTMFWLTITSLDNSDAFVKVGFSLFGVMSISFENEEIVF